MKTGTAKVYLQIPQRKRSKKPKTQEKAIAKEITGKITLEELFIPLGYMLHFTKDNKITCRAVNIYENKVSFEERELSLSSAALIALNKSGLNWKSARGISFWKYKAETLLNI